MLPRRSSLTGLAVGLFAVYVAHTCWVMYGIVHTRPCLAATRDSEGSDGCIRPYLARRPKLQVRGDWLGLPIHSSWPETRGGGGGVFVLFAPRWGCCGFWGGAGTSGSRSWKASTSSR